MRNKETFSWISGKEKFLLSSMSATRWDAFFSFGLYDLRSRTTDTAILILEGEYLELLEATQWRRTLRPKWGGQSRRRKEPKNLYYYVSLSKISLKTKRASEFSVRTLIYCSSQYELGFFKLSFRSSDNIEFHEASVMWDYKKEKFNFLGIVYFTAYFF